MGRQFDDGVYGKRAAANDATRYRIGCVASLFGRARDIARKLIAVKLVLTGNKHRMEGSNQRPRAAWVPG